MTAKEEVVGVVVGESPGEGPRERVGEASLGEEEMSEEGRKVAEEDRKVAEGDHKVEVRPPEEEGMITQEGIQVDNDRMSYSGTCDTSWIRGGRTASVYCPGIHGRYIDPREMWIPPSGRPHSLRM